MSPYGNNMNILRWVCLFGSMGVIIGIIGALYDGAGSLAVRSFKVCGTAKDVYGGVAYYKPVRPRRGDTTVRNIYHTVDSIIHLLPIS
jgi:hypothetical protein